MSEWREVPIAELMAEFHDGPHATPKPAAEGPVFLGIKNLTDDGLLDLARIRHISDEDYRHWTKRVTPRADDIVFTYEATLHRYALIPEGFRGCLGRRLALIRPRTDRADPRYLHQVLRSPEWRQVVEERVISGATVDRIPLIDFPRFPVRVPPLATQHRIAATLAAFDELVAINERRIELLEGLARALYREWFVRLRFPGTDGRGNPPSNWTRSDLGSIAKWSSGGTPSTKNQDYWDGGIPWITSGSLRTMLLSSSERTLTPAGANAGSRMVERDAVLFVVRGMSLIREVRAGIAERPVAFGQDCKALLAVDGIEPLFLAFTVLDRQETMHGMVELAGHGTGKLSTDRVKALPVSVPPLKVQQDFAAAVAPLRDAMSTAMAAAAALTSARDLLLPRLVTGRLDISDVDLGDLLPIEAAV